MQNHNVVIEKLIYKGCGLGRIGGKAVFVPFAAEGDLLEVEIVDFGRSYDKGKIVNILEPSPDRVEPKCKYYGVCGGCHYQHFNYESQLRWKKDILKEQLVRIGKLESVNILDTVPSDNQWKYRNKIQVHCKDGKIGFVSFDSISVIDVDQCLIADDIVNRKLSSLRQREAGQPPAEKRKHVESRAQLSSGESGSFSQINNNVNGKIKKRLDSIICAQAGIPLNVLELYAGSGNFTSVLFKKAKTITAVELDKKAAETGNAQKFPNTKFIASDVSRFMRCYNEKADLIFADPPREGLGKDVVRDVIRIRPKTVIYLSCDPSSLARDVQLLAVGGYRLTSVQPFDMFPQTYHIESLSVLSI